MFTSPLPRSTASARRPLGALALGLVAVLALSGCTGNKRGEFTQYVDTISQVTDVEITTSGASTPLPWSISGRIELRIPAQEATLAALTTAICTDRPGFPISITTTASGDHASFTWEGPGCGEADFDALATVAAADTVPGDSALILEERASADAPTTLTLKIGDQAPIAQQLTLAQAVLPTLPALNTLVQSAKLEIGGDPELLGRYLTDAQALAEAFPLDSLSLGKRYVITMAGAADQAAVERFLTERSPGLYDTLPILVTATGGGSTGRDADQASVALRDRIHTELGYTGSASRNRVSVAVPTIDDLEELSTQIAAWDSGEVSVVLSIATAQGTQPRFEFSPGVLARTLTPTDNPYPTFAQWYRELAATDAVVAVEVGPGRLSVWMTEAAATDAAKITTVTDVIRAIGDKNPDLSSLSLNNRELNKAG